MYDDGGNIINSRDDDDDDEMGQGGFVSKLVAAFLPSEFRLHSPAS